MTRRSSVKVRVGVVALAALAILSFAGCADLFAPTGTVTGLVWDATTGVGISNVRVTVLGRSGYSTTTDDYGIFEFDVPAGSVVLHFVLAGYDFGDVTVVVAANETTEIYGGQILGTPPLQSGTYRFVLDWGELPYDLDSHLITPSNDEVYYANQDPAGAGANLDLDDTSSYGPETVTITVPQTGTYQYFVYNFSGSPDITTSGARVRFYNTSGLVRTFTVPTTGTGRYWLVCTLNGTTGAVTAQGTITDVDPASLLPSYVPAAARVSK